MVVVVVVVVMMVLATSTDGPRFKLRILFVSVLRSHSSERREHLRKMKHNLITNYYNLLPAKSFRSSQIQSNFLCPGFWLSAILFLVRARLFLGVFASILLYCCRVSRRKKMERVRESQKEEREA